MLKVTKKVEYALIALKYMAEKGAGELTSVREICDKFDGPFDTTAKVMQQMNNHGLLKSEKGVKGGYTLAKKLDEVSYLELCHLIEGEEPASICVTKNGICGLHEHCNIIDPMAHLNLRLNSFLSKLTLQELFFGADANFPINRDSGLFTLEEKPYGNK